MDISIVLRAGDPARAAAIARALGLELRDPDRPNPNAFHLRTSVQILVLAADEVHGPGLAIGPARFDKTLDDLAALLGREAIEVAEAGDRAKVAGPDGLAIHLERDAPRITFRAMDDVGSLFSIGPVFRKHRDEILAALRDIDATDPRLVGNDLGELDGGQRWLLVVDAPEGADLESVDRLLARLGAGFAPVKLRRSAEFAPEHLARINRLAFDV